MPTTLPVTCGGIVEQRGVVDGHVTVLGERDGGDRHRLAVFGSLVVEGNRGIHVRVSDGDRSVRKAGLRIAFTELELLQLQGAGAFTLRLRLQQDERPGAARHALG